MRKEIVIRLHSSEKGHHNKAIKVAAAVSGVESVTLAGEEKNLLLVIGFGVDSNHLTEKLRRKVGHAEVVELRTVDADDLHHIAAAEQSYQYRYYPGATPYASLDPYYAGGGYQRHGGAGVRDQYYYTPGGGSYASPLPATMATGGGYYGGGGGAYPSSYHQQYNSQYYPSAATTTNTHTVVHHQYSNEPECTVM